MQSLTRDEKERILRSLEEDREFRYAIAGLIGIREILERLDRHEENQRRLLENQEKLWEEVRELRKGQEKLWIEVKSLRESFRQLGRSLGMTLEHYTAAFLQRYLIDRGYPEELVVEVGF